MYSSHFWVLNFNHPIKRHKHKYILRWLMIIIYSVLYTFEYTISKEGMKYAISKHDFKENMYRIYKNECVTKFSLLKLPIVKLTKRKRSIFFILVRLAHRSLLLFFWYKKKKSHFILKKKLSLPVPPPHHHQNQRRSKPNSLSVSLSFT